MAFGKYCGSTLGVAKLRTASFVFACLGFDQGYSSGRKLLGSFGILWIGILLGNLYLRKVVGRNCELRPLYLRVQALTRNISSGLGIVRKFGDFVVRNFVTQEAVGRILIGTPFSHSQKNTLLSSSFCVFSRSNGLSDHQRGRHDSQPCYYSKKGTRVVSRKGTPNVSRKGASTMEMDAYRDRGGPQPTKHLTAIHDRYCQIIDWQVGCSIE